MGVIEVLKQKEVERLEEERRKQEEERRKQEEERRKQEEERRKQEEERRRKEEERRRKEEEERRKQEEEELRTVISEMEKSLADSTSTFSVKEGIKKFDDFKSNHTDVSTLPSFSVADKLRVSLSQKKDELDKLYVQNERIKTSLKIIGCWIGCIAAAFAILGIIIGLQKLGNHDGADNEFLYILDGAIVLATFIGFIILGIKLWGFWGFFAGILFFFLFWLFISLTVYKSVAITYLIILLIVATVFAIIFTKNIIEDDWI